VEGSLTLREHCLPAFVVLLHCAMFLFAEGDNGDSGTDAARGRLGAISSCERERTPVEIEGYAMAPGERCESEWRDCDVINGGAKGGQEEVSMVLSACRIVNDCFPV